MEEETHQICPSIESHSDALDAWVHPSPAEEETLQKIGSPRDGAAETSCSDSASTSQTEEIDIIFSSAVEDTPSIPVFEAIAEVPGPSLDETAVQVPVEEDDVEASKACEAENLFAQLSLIVEQLKDSPSGVRDSVQDIPRSKKKKHEVDNSADVLGLVIMFDETSELLREGSEPECLKRSKLKKLQEMESYEDSLLGKPPEDLSQVSSECFEDMLGFHLDSIAMPDWQSELESEWDHNESLGVSPASTLPTPTSGNEEIEIVFYYEDDDDDDDEEEVESASQFSESVFIDDEASDECEIVFFACREEETDGEDSSCNDDEVESKYTDCRSTFTPLPNNWFLPQNESFEEEDSIDDAPPPPYKWYLPDHFDVEPRKQATPQKLLKCITFSRSPTHDFTIPTDASTDSSDASQVVQNLVELCGGLQPSTDSSDGTMSVGSGASQVVQNLVELCGGLQPSNHIVCEPRILYSGF
jgi:hypothetical protein